MTFTALHRALGFPPGPLDDDLLDAAVEAGVEEQGGLDWKSELPRKSGLSETDYPKDVAAMANSGGGVIIYGVKETQKAATKRVNVGELDERHAQALRSAAVTAISPPVFGLTVHKLEREGDHAVVVEVPASVDGPHLIYRNHYFGAPVRNDADTVWMKERQIEAMYRARFDERRHATEVLNTLFAEAASGRSSEERAWLIAVGHPRVPRIRKRMDRDEASDVMTKSAELGMEYASRARGGVHPLECVDLYNPRPGLRRWVGPSTATEGTRWRDSWVSVHHDGSVTLAMAVGGWRALPDRGYLAGSQVLAVAIECAVADFMALVRKTAETTDADEYDMRVGIAWAGEEPLTIVTTNSFGVDDDRSTPLHRYTPVEITINAMEPDLDYLWHVHDLARDCVNQGGIRDLDLINPPEGESHP